MTKMIKGPPHTLGDLSGLGVPSELKRSNLVCWVPGESIDTHIVGFCEKIADFLIWGQRALGPKIWPQGLKHLINYSWGPGESIDTHIVGFCEKS